MCWAFYAQHTSHKTQVFGCLDCSDQFKFILVHPIPNALSLKLEWLFNGFKLTEWLSIVAKGQDEKCLSIAVCAYGTTPSEPTIRLQNLFQTKCIWQTKSIKMNEITDASMHWHALAWIPIFKLYDLILHLYHLYSFRFALNFLEMLMSSRHISSNQPNAPKHPNTHWINRNEIS